MTTIAGQEQPANVLQKLQNIQVGGSRKKVKIKKRDMIFMLRNISILVENGLALPRALETLVKEKSLRNYRHILEDVKTRVENGETFSEALSQYPDTFDHLMISQIRIGEKSGTIPATIQRIMTQLEHADHLKSMIIKKLTYPTILVVVGSGAVTFMMMYVVPTFQGIYEESKAKLPAVTEVLIGAGELATAYGWMVALGLVGLVGTTCAVRSNPAGRLWMDTWLLKVPVLGHWFKNIAVLQFMEVLGNLMDAGFTVVEGLRACSNSVGNRRVRATLGEMHEALLEGQKFSDELQKHGDLFPPVVNQLVIVGEKTGTLSRTTVHIRAHLRREVETYTNVMLGSIEPIATCALAAAIGTILLAIYLPMFDMIGAMNPGN